MAWECGGGNGVRPFFLSFLLSVSHLIDQQKTFPSGRNGSVRVDAPAGSSETPWWRITLSPESIPRIALHIALSSWFHRFFSHCRSPI